MLEPLHLDVEGIYRASSLAGIAWLDHGFGTRLSAAWPAGRTLATAKQVHSDTVLVANGVTGSIGEGDALISDQVGVFVAIRTADCLPILIADVRRRAVAAVHAGWRGTVAGIASKTVRAMMNHFDSKIEDLRIVIGPGIAECCFEVGSEVAQQFQDVFPERTDLSQPVKIDLKEANRRQLRQSGVADSHILESTLCTFCDGAHFHSFRRDREAAGRMLSVIGIRE